MKYLSGVVAALLISLPLSAEENKIAVSTPIISTDRTLAGLSIAVPRKNVKVNVTMLDIAPGARLPEPTSPFSRYGYLISGKLDITNTRNGKVETYKPGDFVILDFPIPTIDRWREGVNASSEPAKLLMIEQTEGDGADNTSQ